MRQREDRTRFRGFASISVERRREIASKGGVAGHVKGTAHEWKHGLEAENAGRKGGLASADKRKRAGNADDPKASDVSV